MSGPCAALSRDPSPAGRKRAPSERRTERRSAARSPSRGSPTLPALRLSLQFADVRHRALLARQRAFREPPGLVADGRDMGTVVFPDAALKVFLTASAEERARRRHKQLIEKGISITIDSLLRDIRERDARDATRAVAPLAAAPDAVLLDTTDLSIAAATDAVLGHYAGRGAAPAASQ